MKVAVVHYWFLTRRGGEKVVENILKLFPDADVYTLFYDEKSYGNHLKDYKVFTSRLNNISFIKNNYQKFFPLYPLGIKSLKLKNKYDLIISSESGPAKGIKIDSGIPHLCYIHSPMRYCWGYTQEYLNSVNALARPILKALFERLRKWDETTINNVDLYVANSNNVANRVKKYYNREAEVVYPPISNELFNQPIKLSSKRDVYLSFGAITPYKRIDLLVDTFNENGKKLVIIGEGSERNRLQNKAKQNIEFKGALVWHEIEDIFFKSKALIFPGEEDFGMIPLEVMAYGIPVIAYNKGGALETIIENKTGIEKSSGIFFEEQSIEALQEALNYFETASNQFDAAWIRNHASKFKESIFLSSFKKIVDNFLIDFKK